MPPLAQNAAPPTVTLLPPGQTSTAPRPGAHGAVCSRPDADLHPASLYRHQNRQPAAVPAAPAAMGCDVSGSGAGVRGAPSPAPLTKVALPAAAAAEVSEEHFANGREDVGA